MPAWMRPTIFKALSIKRRSKELSGSESKICGSKLFQKDEYKVVTHKTKHLDDSSQQLYVSNIRMIGKCKIKVEDRNIRKVKEKVMKIFYLCLMMFIAASVEAKEFIELNPVLYSMKPNGINEMISSQKEFKQVVQTTKDGIYLVSWMDPNLWECRSSLTQIDSRGKN